MIDAPKCRKSARAWEIVDHIESCYFLSKPVKESKMEIYKEKTREGRPLVLKLHESDGRVYVGVANKEGKMISWLLSFDDNSGLLTNTHAKQHLDDHGYDTSNFKWGEDGEILISGTR